MDKKQSELDYLNSLRHFCDDFPQGEVIAGERPDFVVRDVDSCVGIEITKMFIKPGRDAHSLQSVEAAQDRITNLAERFAQEMGVPPVTVTLYFNHTRRLYRDREATIAKAVAQTVSDELPQLGGDAHLECRYGSVQPTEVDEIHVSRNTDYHQWKWMEYSRIEKNASGYIQATIQEKSKHIRIYRQECQICWLLIVAETFRGSGNIKPDEYSLSLVYESPFDRTYFFDNGLGKLTRLNTAQMTAEGANA